MVSNLFFKESFRNNLRHIAVVAAFFILATVFTVYAASAPKEVIIECDLHTFTITTNKKYVDQVLRQAKIKLGTYDAVEPGLDTYMKDVDKIVVTRAVDVTVTDVNGTVSYTSSAKDVGEFLKVKGIPMGSREVTNCELTDPLKNGMNINIAAVTKAYVDEVVAIPFGSEKVENASLREGLVYVSKNGVEGSKNQTIEVVYYDGVEKSRTVISEVVTKEPVNEVVEVGTLAGNITGTRGETLRVKKVIKCTATAYDASYESNGSWGPVSATGKALRVGMVAVDPRVIPLGTRLYIEASDGSWVYGYSVAEDTGGAIKGNKVDLFFNTASEVRRFGRRSANVYILE